MIGSATQLKALIRNLSARKSADAQLLMRIYMMERFLERISVSEYFGVHKAVKQIKGYSSHILREEFPWLKSRLPSLWTNSYFVSTVGGAPLSVIKQYIENQKNI